MGRKEAREGVWGRAKVLGQKQACQGTGWVAQRAVWGGGGAQEMKEGSRGRKGAEPGAPEA